MARAFDNSGLEAAREVHLFESDDGLSFGVALDKSGIDLPADRRWSFRQSFLLGVHEAAPVPIDPEPILRGMAAVGHFTWRKRRTEPFGSSQ